MRIYYSLFVLCLLLMSACGKKPEKELDIPPGILSQEQFTKVLRDFSLAESAANINIKNVVVQKTDSVYAFNPLIENKVRQSQYDSSIIFYSANPEVFKKIYEDVLVELSEMQARRNGTKVDSTLK